MTLRTKQLRIGLLATLLVGAVAVPDETFLTADALEATIVGHSLRGRDWIEYYDPDGTIRGKARLFGVRSYTAKWTIRGDRVCYDYDGAAFDTCSRLKTRGEQVYHYDLGGNLKADGIAQRVKGNHLDAFE
jgi:hypothetical protein